MVRRVAPFLLMAAVAFACRTPSERTVEAAPPYTDDTPDSEKAQSPSEPSGDNAAPLPGMGGSSPRPATVLSNEHIEVAGTTRSFVLAAPSTYSATRSYPLVLVLHGDGGNGPSMHKAFALDEVSGQEAFVAYPSGTEGWNLYSPAAENPDLAFLTAVVKDLQGRYSIDTSHVFGTGFSSGGFMVNQIACRRPGFFRAIVPQSGGAPDEPNDRTATTWGNGYTRCENQALGQGPAVMVIHGTTDNVVAPESGDFTANYWSYVNSCASSRTPTTPSPCQQQDGCPSGHPVLYCAIANLGHAIWGDARAATWQFFRSL